MEAHAADHLDGALEVVSDGVSGEAELHTMPVAVDRDLVPAPLDLGGDVRIALDLLADQEEDRFGACVIERIEHARGPLRMRAVVEGERRLRPVETKRYAG